MRSSRLEAWLEYERGLPGVEWKERSRGNLELPGLLGADLVHEDRKVATGATILGPGRPAVRPEGGLAADRPGRRVAARAGRQLHLHVPLGRDADDKTPPHPQQEELGKDQCY